MKFSTLFLLLLILFLLFGCTPFHHEWRASPKKCQVWVQIDGKGWHCYERGEVLRELSRASSP